MIDEHRRRIGIFGGSFDPPHIGHVQVARDVADALLLDEVLWVPAREPPHKVGAELTAPPSIRLKMARAAAHDDPRFRVSDMELRRPAPSYTIDTLRSVRSGKAGSGTDLFLIMGFDQYRDFASWRAPDEIRNLATLAVMDRGGEGLGDTDDGDREGVVSVPVRRVDVSSTEVRARLGRGDDVSDLVPPAVERIIREEGLYRDDGRPPEDCYIPRS